MSGLCLGHACRFTSAASLAAQRSLLWQPSQASENHLTISFGFTNAVRNLKHPGAHGLFGSHDLLFRPAGDLLATPCSSLLLQGLRTHKSLLHSLSGQKAEYAPGIKATVPKPSLNIKERTNGYLRESLLLSYTALFDNVIFRVFEWLRLDKILKWLTPYLEDGYSTVTGMWACLARYTCIDPPPTR